MPTDVETLKEMGFPENRCQKALAKSGYKGVQAAMDWLFAHAEDADIDDPYEMSAGHSLTSEGGESEEPNAAADGEADAEAKSLKCDDCGKLLVSEASVQMHAARTGHSNFSESTEEIKPLTEEERKQQADTLQEKLIQKRLDREKKEKAEALEKERLRRKTGKEHSDVKFRMEQDEMKKLTEQTRREKLEEKIARQKVMDMIAQDRANRSKLFPTASEKAAQESSSGAPVTPPICPTVAPVAIAPVVQKEYDTTRLQIRLASGQPLTESFSVNEQLSSVRLFVQTKQNLQHLEPRFTFMTTFPRKVYSDDDMGNSLKDLGLVPSAVLMVKDL